MLFTLQKRDGASVALANRLRMRYHRDVKVKLGAIWHFSLAVKDPEKSAQFWTANFDQWPALASEVMISLCEGLEREGIRVPFPQRDLHVRTIDAARAVAIGAPTPDAERTPPLGKTGAGPGG